MTLRSLLLTLLLVAAAAPSLAGPRIEAAEQSYSFGDIYQGEKASHAFRFTNSGDAPLVIDKVRSSCGCTAVMVSKGTLQPGETGEVRATFDSTRFRGPVSKKIYISSNAAAQQNFEFQLSATVREVIALAPHMVSAGPLPAGKEYSVDVVLHNRWTGPVTITAVESGLEQLQTRLERETLGSDEKSRLTLSITPGKELRRLNSYVILKTDNPLLPEIRIPLNLVVNTAG